ncbi:FUSC family protein [Sulfobacillus harzensis]|uniref:Integral membrane bound transporter domain-containing protein n=1 Tax=Sulfobacillus harzensis TaxID=2729629 RepID=A0A7Y0L608_9FIRM|nr:FUSC family protein [Sulfobacillus harzensis]NMP23860.1 hypothetical protein [Sulfobacillus harzensis]
MDSPRVQVLALKNTPTPWRRLWGTGLTTSLGLVIGLLLGHLEWGIWAFMGGFTSLYVQKQPYRTRAITLALVGMGLAASMALGALSAVWWEMALALGFVSAASTYLTGSFDVPLPAGFMFVLVACISAALPLHPPGIVGVRVLCVLGGASLAWLVGMSDWLWDRRGPTSAPVKGAFTALSHYVAAIGGGKAKAREFHAAQAVALAHRVALSSNDRRIRAMAVQAEKIFRAAVALSSDIQRPLDPKWAHVLAIVAAHITKPLDSRPGLPLFPDRHCHTVGRFIETVEETLRVAQSEEVPQTRPALYRPTVKERLARGLDQDSMILPAVLRIGIATATAVALARLLGITHPFWTPLTAAAVLQGVSTVVITQRTIQRAIGTTLGLALTALLLLLHPIPILTAVLVVVLQLSMLFFIAKNYGISVIFITTMALVIIYAGTHTAVAPMIFARFIDTLIGGAWGLLAAFLLWGQASSARLPVAMARSLRRAGHLFQAVLKGSSPKQIIRLRTACLDSLLALRHLYVTSLGELPHPPANTPALFSVERLGYLVMAVCDAPRALDALLADDVGPVFNQLADRVEDRSDAEVRIPALPRFPAIEDQLWETAEALDALPERREKSS